MVLRGQVSGEVQADEPDRTLHVGLQEGESEPTAMAAGDSVYSSAASFEELPLSEELLQARCSPTCRHSHAPAIDIWPLDDQFVLAPAPQD